MIHRDRSSLPPPDELVKPDSPGQKELKEILAWLGANRRGERPPFKAYKSASVIRSLEKLFAGKCAYCETSYTRSQPVDVEHWRPKAEVEIEGRKDPLPGYEWLAADWSNLLPSCTDCNRKRTQEVWRIDPQQGLQRKIIVVGKANAFPLLVESRRATTPAQVAGEQPLLLNPCHPGDDPAKYFRFTDEGVIIPHPSLAAASVARRRALTSIEVYALNRKGLVEERRERILVLKARFEFLRALLDLASQMHRARTAEASSWRSVLLDLIDQEIARLKELCQPTHSYSLLSTQFVNAFLQSL